MALDPIQFITLVRGLVDADPKQRDLHADEVTDIYKDFDSEQYRCIALMLAELSLLETDWRARQTQLYALSELDEWGDVPPRAIELVRLIDVGTLYGSEIEYVEWLTRDRD